MHRCADIPFMSTQTRFVIRQNVRAGFD